MWKSLFAMALGGLVWVGCDQDSVDGPSTTQSTDPDPVERGTPADPQPGNPLEKQSAHPDHDFLRKAAESNFAEIEAGRLGAEKAENADVKAYGRHMIDDHTQAQQRLEDLARQEDVALPKSPDGAHLKEMERLRGLSGAEFDKAFMGRMVEDHQKSVSLFEKASKQAKDEQVKAFAEKTLPVLKEHLQKAKDLNTQVGGKSAD